MALDDGDGVATKEKFALMSASEGRRVRRQGWQAATGPKPKASCSGDHLGLRSVWAGVPPKKAKGTGGSESGRGRGERASAGLRRVGSNIVAAVGERRVAAAGLAADRPAGCAGTFAALSGPATAAIG